MDNHKVSNIKFTPTELIVISCFTVDASKPSTIAKILDKPIKTIYTHLDKIKSKINVQSIDAITLFVRKSAEFKELQKLFKQQYIDYYYRGIAKKISHKLRPLNILCNIIVSDKSIILVTDEIASLIELLGINTNKIDTTISNDKLETDGFCILVNQDINSIPHMQSNQNYLYLVLNKSEKNIMFNKSLNVIFYNTDNKKDFYKFVIDYLIENYHETIELKGISNFSSEIDNIVNNIQSYSFKSLNNQQIKKRTFTLWDYKYLITILIAIAILSGIYWLFYGNQTDNSLHNIVKSHGIGARKSNKQWAWNIPPRNKRFTGREDAFKQIKKNLNQHCIGVITQSIVGSGGIGKTQLATEYAYRAIENKEYNVIVWINAENQNSIDNSYNIFANKLKINTHGLQPEQVRRIIYNELLEKHAVNKILFVLDNVPKKEDIQLYLTEIHKQFSADIKLHILITSRNQHWIEDTFLLDIFTKEEAKEFIKKHLANEAEQDIIKLAKTLHYFPLALGQAVGYIKQHTSIEDYLKLYQAKQQQYLDIKPQDTSQYQETLWQTLSVTLTKLSNPAKMILYISSYLEPDNIQLELFNTLSLEDKSQVIQELRKNSLIILNNPKSFKIHRLLQQVVRLTIKNKKKWLNKTIKIATQVAKNFDKQNKNSCDIAKIWLHHISILSQYIPQSLDKATLLHNYGDIAQHFGLYDLSKSVYLISLKIKETYYNNIELADALNNLGWIEFRLGKYENAKSLFQRTLNIQETHYQDPNHIELASTLSNLGWVKYHFGKYEKAKNLLQRALEIREAHYQNSSHIHLTKILNKLGWVEYRLGKYENAKSLFQRTLNIQETHYQDPNHIELASTLSNLGWVEYHFGKYEKAKNLLQRSLEIRKAHYQNPSHIHLARTLNSLGWVEFRLGKYEKAKNLFHKALAIREIHYQDPMHIKLSFLLHNLGLIEEKLGNYFVALKYLNKSYSIWNKYYQTRLHDAVFHIYAPTGIWPNLNKNNLDKSIKYYQTSLRIAKKLFGDKHHFVARYYYMLGQACEANNQIAKAIEQYKISLKIATEFDKTIEDKSIQEGHRKNIALVKNKLEKLRKKRA